MIFIIMLFYSTELYNYKQLQYMINRKYIFSRILTKWSGILPATKTKLFAMIIGQQRKNFPESIESDEEHTCVNFLQDHEDELPECAGFSMDFESHER